MTEQRKARLLKWNIAYRNGNPIVSDQRYDVELMALERELSSQDFEDFRLHLGESGGSIKHPATIGSLENVYSSNPLGKRTLASWIKEQDVQRVFVSEKIDGMSSVVHYLSSEPVLSATRGDGYSGEKIQDRKTATMFPALTEANLDLQFRCELTLTGDTHKKLGLKNRRNGTVGIVKSEDASDTRFQHIQPIAYHIIGSRLPRVEQYKRLEDLGFQVPKHAVLPADENLSAELEKLYEAWSSESDYDIDGIVACDIRYSDEASYYPKKMVAFKVLKDGIQTTITGIDLRVSKGGKITPVLQIEPIEIDGTTVSQASAYNFGTVRDKKLGVGATVTVHKAGEIIPEVVEVIHPVDPVIPCKCPSCNEDVEFDENGTNLLCKNQDCGVVEVRRVAYLLKNFDVSGASESSFRKWGISTLEDLLSFRPDPNSKSQTSFYDQFVEKVLNCKVPEVILSRMSFDFGGGEKTLLKVIEFYGIDGLDRLREMESEPTAFPPSVKMATLTNIIAGGWKRNREIYEQLISDPRRTVQSESLSELNSSTSTGPFSGMTFLATGKLSKPRKEIETWIVSQGGTISGAVNSSLDVLVVGEKAGSKLDRAKKLGTVQILNEDELYALPSSSTSKSASL